MYFQCKRGKSSENITNRIFTFNNILIGFDVKMEQKNNNNENIQKKMWLGSQCWIIALISVIPELEISTPN